MPDLRETLELLANDPKLGADLPTEAIPQMMGMLRTIEVVLLGRQRRALDAVETAPSQPRDDDCWLAPDEVARMLGKSRSWVYRIAKRWSFAKRPTRRTLLISERGLRKWMERQ